MSLWPTCSSPNKLGRKRKKMSAEFSFHKTRGHCPAYYAQN
jgi:hypothetical protein